MIERNIKLFYGAHVPDDEYAGHPWHEEQRLKDYMDDSLKDRFPGLTVITAGPYDQHELFLAVVPKGEGAEVTVGGFEVLTESSMHADADWDNGISALWRAAGYGGHPHPGWIIVATEY